MYLVRQIRVKIVNWAICLYIHTMNVRKKKVGDLYTYDWDLFKLILIVNAVLPLIMLLMCQMFQY